MDNNSIHHHLLGQTGVGQKAPARNQQEKKDMGQDLHRNFAELFADEMEDEDSDMIPGPSGKDKSEKKEKTASEKMTETSQTETDVIEGKQTKEEERREAIRQEESRHTPTNAPQGLQNQASGMSSMLGSMQSLMYKNRDAMSLSERRMVGMDKMDIFQRHDIEFAEMKKMLTQRGLSMSDLTTEHLLNLSKRNTKEQVSSYLDFVLSQKRSGKLEKWETVSDMDKNDQLRNDRRQSEEVTAVQNRTVAQVNADLQQAFHVNLADQTNQQEKVDKAQKQREMMDEIIKKVDVRNFLNRTELVMKLNPEFMSGDLQLKLSYEDEKIDAFFETTSREMRDMLEESTGDLAEAFSRKGLTINKTKVTLVDFVASETEDSEV